MKKIRLLDSETERNLCNLTEPRERRRTGETSKDRCTVRISSAVGRSGQSTVRETLRRLMYIRSSRSAARGQCVTSGRLYDDERKTSRRDMTLHHYRLADPCFSLPVSGISPIGLFRHD